MKLLILLVLVAVAAARPDDHYDTKYDDFNVDELKDNKRLLHGYSHCFLGDGKCTGEGNDIKKWIPEAIASSCGKCTEKQKVVVAKFITFIKSSLPEEYTALIKKNDPDNKYSAELEAFLAKYSA